MKRLENINHAIRALTFTAFFLLFNVSAEVPRHVAYQGLLKDATGKPMPGPVNLVIRFYDAETEGNLLFQEEHKQIQLTNGVYSIQIGNGFELGTEMPTNSISAAIFGVPELWLSESVNGGDELEPRLKAGSSIFALKSHFAEQLVRPGTSSVELIVNVSGEIGIGTNFPTSKLMVEESFDGSGSVDVFSSLPGVVVRDTSDFVGMTTVDRDGDFEATPNDKDSMIYWGDNGDDSLKFSYAPNGAMYTEIMRITPQERVGIGTVSPASKFMVEESFDGSGSIDVFSSLPGMVVRDTSDFIGMTTIDRDGNFESTRNDKDGMIFWGDDDDDSLRFSFAPAGGMYKEVMRITAAGNVVIGKVTPEGKLHIADQGTSAGAPFLRVGDDTFFSDIDIANTIAIHGVQDNSIATLELGKGGVRISGVGGNLNVEGGVLCSLGTACNSDIRWKKEIKTIGQGLEKITELRGVEYQWKKDKFPDKNFEEGNQIGFIAQEVQAVIPELVRTDSEGFKSLDYARLTAVLVEAVKDLKQQLDTSREKQERLQEEVKELRSLSERMAALEQQLSLNP